MVDIAEDEHAIYSRLVELRPNPSALCAQTYAGRVTMGY